ncbi:hypothetical protein [Pseudoalteromonas phage J2-1_QLiu-2017]|nr:hypothetical protein [Pseudoalteromonas phage J2-1_QLiu-2017]
MSMPDKHLTQQYRDALEQATHVGVVTGLLYKQREGSLRATAFGVSSLSWTESMFDYSVVTNSTNIAEITSDMREDIEIMLEGYRNGT